jgi:hypothetical protein
MKAEVKSPSGLTFFVVSVTQNEPSPLRCPGWGGIKSGAGARLLNVASALCADLFEPQARHYNEERNFGEVIKLAEQAAVLVLVY